MSANGLGPRARPGTVSADGGGASAALSSLVEWADAIVIGAGAGLSIADGDAHAGPVFEERFADFMEARGITDAYSGGFYPFPTPEERWAFWARMISLLRYEASAGHVYRDLFDLVRDHDFFVVTTNVDHRFQMAGFPKERLFYTQGDYGLFQCATPCHNATYDNRGAVEAMLAAEHAMRVPSPLLPRCPRCSGPMTTNLRVDGRFVQDDGWEAAARRYADFCASHERGRVLHLELGVGANTPGIIKYPFWRRTLENPEARYATVALDACAPHEIADRSLVVRADIAAVLASAVHQDRALD